MFTNNFIEMSLIIVTVNKIHTLVIVFLYNTYYRKDFIFA